MIAFLSKWAVPNPQHLSYVYIDHQERIQGGGIGDCPPPEQFQGGDRPPPWGLSPAWAIQGGDRKNVPPLWVIQGGTKIFFDIFL